jgi:hypothetical protein
MAWQTPKTDWTSSDYYNYSDLNRVENNTGELENLVDTYFSIQPLTKITDRTNIHIEYYDSLNRVESNILALKDATFQPLEWETPKTNWQSVSDAFSYVDANRLEKNLVNLKLTIENTIDEMRYCGTFYSGDTFGDLFSDWGCL